jgi:hypothetical protein
MTTTTIDCAFCGRELEEEWCCTSDDCPERTAEIEVERVGEVPLAEHGSRDEVVLLTRHDHDTLTPAEGEQWLLPRVYADTGRAGGYFCHGVTAMQHPFRPNQCFVLIHHRWDV